MYSNLQYLHLWGNKITDEGAMMLTELIQEHNDTLLELSLFNNPIKMMKFLMIKELVKQNVGFSQIAVLREKGVFNDNKEEKIEEDEYEEDFEDEDDVKDYDEEDKENKATEQKDEEELREIEKEISDAEREFEQEKRERRALKEKQGKVKEKVWQGFSNKSGGGGMLHSTFKEK